MTAEDPPTSSSAPDTASARGAIRDALGGFRNLLGLLRSIRVGPQAVGAVVPDVHASCAPMVRALRTLLTEVPESCRDDLAAFLLPEAAAIEQVLGSRVRRPMRAKDRLEIERALSHGVRHLEIGFRLLSLQHAVRHRRLVSVDVAELAIEEGSLVAASPSATRLATLSVPPGGTTVLVDPALMAALLALAAGVLPAGPVPDAFALDVETTDVGHRLTLRSAGAPGGRTFTVLQAAPPTWACLEAFAKALGYQLEIEADRIHIVVPRSPPT